MNLLEALTWFSVVITGGLSITVLVRRPPAPLWPILFYVMATSCVWCLGEVLTSFIVVTEVGHWNALVLQYIGVLFVPPVWWIFALRFAESQGSHQYLRSAALRWVPLLFAVIFWFALVTNPFHGMFLTARLGARNEFHLIWYIQATVSYALMLAVVGLFVYLRRRATDSTLREQLLILLGASLVPMLLNFLYITKIVNAEVGLTAAGLGVSMLLFFTGIYRDRLFWLSSVSMSHLIAHERDGMLLADRQGRLLHFNPAATRLLEGTELLLSSNVFELLARALRMGDDPTPLVFEEMERDLMAGVASPNGAVYRVEGASNRWLEIQIVPIPGRSGRRQGTGLRLRDVTALRDAREKLREQAAVLEAILGSAEQGMLVIDSSGAMIFSNRAFRAFWSISDEDMQTGVVLARVEGQLETPEPFMAGFRVSAGQTPTTKRLEMRLRDGRVAECSSRSLMMDEELVGRVWSFFDVTAERSAEEERAQFEAQMLQAQKMESLGILAGGIAHDFNNLLAGILGNADIALNLAPPDSAMRGPLLDVVDASRRAAELANQMLAYSGRGHFVIRPIDLPGITNETRHLLEAVISKDAVVDLDLAPVPLVEGDPTRLRQVIMNLITNASDALESRPGVIRVSTRLMDVSAEMLIGLQFGDAIEPGRYVCLEVADSGVGMDEDTIARIFDPFFTTKFTGRGLGLSAVLGIVRAHQGALFVDSRQGRGTTIKLLLPSMDRDAVEETGPTRPASNEEAAWRGSGAVLVVDDELPVLRVLSRILKLGGFGVFTAENGAEALERYAEHSDEIVAVILDMTMPGRGGRETLVDLRSAGARVPIILASGYSEIDTRDQLQGEQPNGFLQKPFSSQELLSILRRELEAS